MPWRASLQRFENLWSRCCSDRAAGAQAQNSSRIGTDLLDRYGESGRLYHTIDHINHCLGEFDQVRDDCSQADAVELAIWFHDAVYNFPAVENEKLSAAFFLEVSDEVVESAFRHKVAALVMATEHLEVPTDADQRILVDVDLSSFGLPWEQFAADGKNIRQELHYLSDARFYSGQIAFMESLLARKTIFNTDYFFDQYEQKARENVSQYLSALRDRGFMQ